MSKINIAATFRVTLLTLAVCYACVLSASEASTIEECLTIAANTTSVIDNAIETASTDAKTGSHSSNLDITLRNVYSQLRHCGFIARDTQFEDPFNYASGLAIRMSAIINDTNDSRLMSSLEDMYIEITNVLDDISKLSVER